MTKGAYRICPVCQPLSNVHFCVQHIGIAAPDGSGQAKKVKFQTFCRFTVKCYFACACGVNMRMPFGHNGPFACSSLYGAAFLQKLL